MTSTDRSASTLGIAAALVAVYLIWGSTYLAIRLGLESFPPFLMGAARWLVAGALIYAYRRARGDAAPTLVQWRSAAIVGGLLVVGGNGVVSWAQQWVPSGLTALLIAIVPLYIAVLEWLRDGARPTPRIAAGIALGFTGALILVGSNTVLALGGAGLAGALATFAILLAALSWATGSLYSRKAPRPKSHLLAASMQMLAGGAILLVAGSVRGEFSAVDLDAATSRSWFAFAFLVVFGSVVAYSAYVWLLQVTRASLVATYAFVNPVVAVILGTLIAFEPFTLRIAFVAALIVAAVALVVTAPKPVPMPASQGPNPSTANDAIK